MLYIYKLDSILFVWKLLLVENVWSRATLIIFVYWQFHGQTNDRIGSWNKNKSERRKMHTYYIHATDYIPISLFVLEHNIM